MLIFNVKPRIKNSFTNLIVWNTYKSIALLKAQISGTPHNEVSPNAFLSLAARSRYSLLSPLILSAKRSLFVVPKSWKRLMLGTSMSSFKVCRSPCGPGKQILCWWDTSKWCSPVSQRLAVMLGHSLTPPAQQCFFETRHPQASKMLLPQPSSKHLGNTWEGPAPNPAGQPWCWVCWCLQTPPVLNQQCGVHSHHHHLQGKKHLCKTQLGLPQLTGASLPFPKGLTKLFCIVEGRIIPKLWHASCYRGSHLETHSTRQRTQLPFCTPFLFALRQERGH